MNNNKNTATIIRKVSPNCFPSLKKFNNLTIKVLDQNEGRDQQKFKDTIYKINEKIDFLNNNLINYQ